MNIQIGDTVQTKYGEVGVVRSISDFNGSIYYRLQTYAKVGWGNGLHLTDGRAFVGAHEVVAIKKATSATEAAKIA